MTWNIYHVLIMLPLLLISLMVAYFLRRVERKHYDMIIRITVITLFCCEILKQIIALFKGYYALFLPFHYSSSYYICLAYYAFGRKHVKQVGECVLQVGGVLLLATMLFSPASVVGSLVPSYLFSSFYAFYSLFYHIMILFVWFCMLMRGDYRPQRYDFISYTAFLSIWGVIALPAAHFTGLNYAGLLESYIPFLTGLCENFYVLYIIVYYLGALCVAAGTIYGYKYLRYLADKRAEKKKQQTS